MDQESCAEQIAEYILYELWFSVAEALFERVADATELDEDQRAALRAVALRPNDFQVHVGD
jgi:hypothetical protein